MAKFGESFLAQLGRPDMMQGMFGLGQAIGGIPGRRQEQQKKQEFNQLMQQGQKAMASGDAAALASVAQQLAAAGYQQQAQQLAKASREATEKQQQQRQTTNVAKGQQALATFATARGMNMGTPQAREGFFRIAKAYGVPVDQASEIYKTFTTTSGDRTTKGEVIIRDSQGNLFSRATQYGKQGQPSEVILPFPGSPKKPVGQLSIVSGTTGAGAFDRPEIAGETTVEQQFNEQRVAAVSKLPSMRRSATNIREAIDLLESGDVTTGGFTRRVSRGLSDFLGKTPKDIGEFETRLGDIVLARLESFTGAISEGERNFLIEQIGSYQASGESNLGRLKVLLEQAEGLLQDSISLASASDFESYRKKLMQPDLSFIPEAERQEAMEAFQRGEVSVQELRGMY